MKISINILIILLFYSASYSQINILRRQNNSITNNYIELAQKIKTTNKQKALKYIDLGIQLITTKNQNQKSNNKANKNLSELYFTKSKIYEYHQNWDSANIFYKKAIPYYLKNNDTVQAAKCYINIGATDYYYGRHELALENYEKARQLLNNSNKKKLLSKIYNNLGLLYKATGNYQLSIHYFHKSIDLSEYTDNKNSIANSYNNIGTLYWEQKNYKQALICYEKTITIYEKLDNQKNLAATYINIGLIYSHKKDTTKAIQYYNQAIEISKQTNYKMGLANALQNKAILISKPDNYDKEKQLFIQSLKLFEELGYARGIFISKMNISRIYALEGENKKAINYALQAIELKNVEQPLSYLVQSYLILAKNYTDIKNYKSANLYYLKYIEINDTLYNKEKNEQINEIRIKYETDKKEDKIIILTQEGKINALKIEQKDKKIKTISFILIIIILFSIISIILYFQKRASYLSLVEQNVKIAKSDIQKEINIKTDQTKQIKPIGKYSDTNLDAHQKHELINNIIILMEEEKYYLNAKFTSNDFAKKLHSNRNYISQVINEHFKTNFSNFVNEYRVKEARKRLINTDFDNYSIEGIAKSVGFNSKSTFNNAFKKCTGVTPSFFKKNSKKI